MIDQGQVKRQLERICGSPQFRAAGRLRDFLIFVVEQTLAGNKQQLKEYSIATDVYARLPSFDPKLDSIVRVEAIKLRARLGEYYGGNGSSDEIRICIPKGGYVPEFHNYGRPLASGTASGHQVSELCEFGFAALMRCTPASLDVAAACFLEARDFNPSDPRPHIGLANCHGFALSNEAKRPAEVMDELRSSALRALQLNQNSGDAHIAASVAYFFVEGTAGKAMEEVRRALQLEPRNAIAHFWAPALLSAAGRHEASLAHMREAIRCAPNCILFRVYLGRVLYYAGRSAEAVQVLKGVARVEPGLAVGHLWSSLAHTEIEQHDEAIDAASRSVCLSETSATLSAHAYVLARAGRRDEAECIFDRLSANPPYGYVSPVNLAAIAEALNRGEAVAMYMARARQERAWGLLLQEVDPRLQRIQSKLY
jgi:tetratricopeptide (TPR) repeat protein